LVYAYLQLGQDKKARDVVDEMNAVSNINPSLRGGLFALAASPARYVVERGDWQAAAALPDKPGPLPYTEAMSHFVRALGAARTGKPDAATPEIAKLAELRDKLTAAKDPYWANQVDIQRQVATAWQLAASGKVAEGLSALPAPPPAADQP